MMGGIRPGVFARLTRKTSGHTKEDGREIGWVNNPGYVDGSVENEAMSTWSMWSSDSRMASGHVGRL
jgi:hypothetical protein